MIDRQLPDFHRALREWLWGCPIIKEHSHGLHMDYLGAEEGCFTLLSAPSAIEYRRNILGQEIPTERQRVQFALAARVPYGEDTAQNLDNLETMTQISNWIQLHRPLPRMDGAKVLSITSTVTPYPQQPGTGTARYHIPITIQYSFV